MVINKMRQKRKKNTVKLKNFIKVYMTKENEVKVE